MDLTSQPQATLVSLVGLAVSNDDPGVLIAAAGPELGRPLGLVDPSGAVLGRSPPDGDGERAVTIARAAARNTLAAPAGWTLVPLRCRKGRLGVLAIGPARRNGADRSVALGVLPVLLTDQLRRAALVSLQHAAFVRRLVSSPAPAPHRAHREAAEIGVVLADAYWAAILTGQGGHLRPDVVEVLERDALSRAGHALTALLDNHLILLHPAGPGRERAAAWFEAMAMLARTVAPSTNAHAIAADEPADLDGLSAQARKLAHLAGFGPRGDGDRAVSWAEDYALDDLLRGQIAPDVSSRFIDDQIGPLIVWDRDHGTNLLEVLEAALDCPRHEHAANRCFMHRNTFRHRLDKATKLLGAGLTCPERRLAVHLAIKMHRAAGADAASRPAGPPPRRRAADRSRRPQSRLRS